MHARFGFALIAVLLTILPARAADHVTLRLDWVFGSEHAPIFLAKEKGFFRDEGIDVDILAGEGSTVTIKLVGNRTADFGYAGADQVLMAAARELPVVSTAVILQDSPSAVIYPASLDLRSLKDLYGKTLGLQLRSNTEKQWRAVEKIQGLDASKIREVPADRAIAQLIANKSIDAGIAYFFNDALKLESDGVPMKWTLFSAAGLPIYSSALVTNADLIKSNPDLVRRFTRAFVKGWVYAIDHEQETLDVFLKANPTVDPKYSALKLPAVLGLTKSSDTDAHGLGYSTLAKWTAMQKTLLDIGIMTGPVDVSNVFTNDDLK